MIGLINEWAALFGLFCIPDNAYIRLYICLPAALPQRLRSVVSSSANPMSEQEMDLHTIR